MESIYLWSQSLDNSSPAVIFVDGRKLDPKKYSARREDLVTWVSEVTANSTPKRVGTSQRVSIYNNKNKFVIEIVLPEKDNQGRKAPIICYGSLAEPEDKLFSKTVIHYLEKFIDSINRSFPNDIRSDVISALSLAKKKRISIEKILISVFLFLICFLFLYLSIIFLLTPN